MKLHLNNKYVVVLGCLVTLYFCGGLLLLVTLGVPPYEAVYEQKEIRSSLVKSKELSSDEVHLSEAKSVEEPAFEKEFGTIDSDAQEKQERLVEASKSALSEDAPEWEKLAENIENRPSHSSRAPNSNGRGPAPQMPKELAEKVATLPLAAQSAIHLAIAMSALDADTSP